MRRQHAHGVGEVVELLQYMQRESSTLGDLLGHSRHPTGQAAMLGTLLAAALRGAACRPRSGWFVVASLDVLCGG